jgi:hypothetical protein
MSTPKVCGECKDRDLGLFEKPAFYQGPCRHHQGGERCSLGLKCKTEGHKTNYRVEDDDGTTD